jgi:proteasome lid subunit RPN8/RPN11
LSTPFLLKIPRRFYEEMVAQALSELPNECCGLLAGTIRQTPVLRVGKVERVYPLVNAVELTGLILSYLSAQPFDLCMGPSPVEYLSDPQSMFAAVRDMWKQGIDILAVYHSHPTSGPIPSRTDLDRNYSSEVMNLIISLQNPQQPEIRGWWLDQDRYAEADWVCDEQAGPT